MSSVCTPGSTLLNESMSSFLLSCFTVFVVLSFLYIIMSSYIINNYFMVQLHMFVKNAVHYFNYLLNLNTSDSRSLTKIKTFVQELLFLSKYALFGFVTIVVFTAPIYILKSLGIGHTHEYQYGWLMNLVYVKGVVMALLIVLAWIGVIGTMFLLYYKCDMTRIRSQLVNTKDSAFNYASSPDENDKNSEMVDKPYDFKVLLEYAILGTLNLVIVVIVNGSYVYSSYQNLAPTTTLWIQLSLAIFKMLYSKFVPILTMNISDATTNISVRSMLNIFNNLLIPCVAVAFTSPACYQVF